MKRIISLLPVIGLWLLSSVSFAQNQSQFPFTVSISNTASQLPGSGVLGIWTTPTHPGVTVGTEFFYNSNPKHQWFQTGNLGYFFHQYAQHGIQLYTEAGYRFQSTKGFFFGPKLGVGYLHSIPETRVFELNENGSYDQKSNLGRPQFMPTATLQLGYQFQKANPISVFLNYQLFMQLPFVNEYVPILPNTALHLGVSFYPFKKQSK